MSYYLRTGAHGNEIRGAAFRDDLDPGWEARWKDDPQVRHFATMAEVDKHIHPDSFTVDDTWRLAAWAAKQIIVWNVTENMTMTAVEARAYAARCEQMSTPEFYESQRNLVAAISEMERKGLLNVPAIEERLRTGDIA